MSSSSKVKLGNVATYYTDVVNRQKMRKMFKWGIWSIPFFCGILHGRHHILFHFRMFNNIFEYETPKNIILGPSYVAPQPP